MPSKSGRASTRRTKAQPPRAGGTSTIVQPLAGANLRYASDEAPGIRRRRYGRGFAYFDAAGARITDPETLLRIRSLAIPPAYKEVWICPSPYGHLQATGVDARGRKQYRYHPQWRAVRDAHKFDRMLEFGAALTRIHRRVARDLRLPGMARERVLATVVRLLERTLIRVGNQQYVRENRSYGLTTLRNRHVAVRGDLIRFEFRGKAGIQHELSVEDREAAAVVRRCLDLPGQELFQYVDEAGELRDIDAADVNDYLREASGEDYTAKDFRTWYATIGVLEELSQCEFSTAQEAQVHIKTALKNVAQLLGNTPAMCRKCYVHPAVLEAFLSGRLHSDAPTRRLPREQLLQLLKSAAKRAKVQPAHRS